MDEITVRDYQKAEREFEVGRARVGLVVHAVITALVSAALITINVVVAPEFPWSPFPVGGMLIGLTFHYVGVRRLDEVLAARQAEIEAVARRHAA